MIRRIYWTIAIIISFVSIIILINQLVINQFKISSDKILLEYNELYSLQDFKASLIYFQNHFLESDQIDDDLIHHDSLFNYLEIRKLNCERYVTKKHLDENWSDVLINFEKITFPLQNKDHSLNYQVIKEPSENILLIVDRMIEETFDEIIETEERNHIIQKHGSITVLVIGIISILLISLISLTTGRKITIPVRKFLNTFSRLSAGEKDARVDISRRDEFGKMAEEFNILFDKLNKTTVTLDYVRNVIDNIYGALFVTDIHGRISFCNMAAVKLLGTPESELVHKQVGSFFSIDEDQVFEGNIDPENTQERIEALKNSTLIKKSDGKVIPVMTTCTELNLRGNKGLIVVAHDISEKYEYEAKLEEIKRKNLIEINEAQELERTRIASDLHDGLGQKLSAISYSLQNLGIKSDAHQKIEHVQNLVDKAIDETRTISHSLMPGVLMDFGLIAGLKDLVDGLNKIENIVFEFNHYDFEERIEPKLEKALFRISQEALNNIVKHSKAKNATIQLFKSIELITLTIDDDGVGFDPKIVESNERGIGLYSIRERVFSFNGTLTLDSVENKGTQLIVEIPYISKK